METYLSIIENLPESHYAELNRVGDIEAAHIRQHRRDGTACGLDDCTTCKALQEYQELICAGRRTLMIEVVEEMAFKVADQQANQLLGGPINYNLWEGLFTAGMRMHYRKQAVELLIQLSKSVGLSQLPLTIGDF